MSAQLSNAPKPAVTPLSDSKYHDQEQPIILSSRWNDFVSLKKLRGIWKRCPTCGWAGDPTQLLARDEDDDLVYENCQKTAEEGCVPCKLFLRLMEGSGMPLDGSYHLARFRGPVFGVEDKKGDIDTHWTLFLTGTDNNTPKGIPRFPLIPGDTSSEASLKWVQEQISTCLKQHPNCGAHNTSFLPTRLICISPLESKGYVVLREKEDIPEGSSYIALSHCWGKILPKCITTRETLLDRKTAIPWDTFPKTFQNAITFTQKLGIEYLWIDSLCIIQGDAEDWMKEAGKMFHVYRNSYVTLAAYQSKDSSGGLFYKLPHEPQVKLGNVQMGSHRYDLWARRTFKHYVGMYCHTGEGGDKEAMQYAPLFTRAWTFQERLVSPRVVLFAGGEVMWECSTYTACECQYKTLVDDVSCPKVMYAKSLATTKSHRKRFSRSNSDKLRTTVEYYVEDGVKVPFRLMSWHIVVAIYSTLNLTKETDKLPAISAVAEQISASKPGQEYLAGLWSDSLIDDLMWETAPVEGNRYTTWTAPSWSWASVRSSVDWDPNNEYRPLATVTNASCVYASDNPFGVLKTGTISLRGRMVKGILEKHRSPTVQIEPFSIRIPQPELLIHSRIMVDSDDPPSNTAGSEIPVIEQQRVEDTVEPGNTPSAGKTPKFKVELVYKKDILLLEIAENNEAREVPKGIDWLERDKFCLILKVNKDGKTYSRVGLLRLVGPRGIEEALSEEGVIEIV
ncbi:heterokaryon incompatibility protein-domain-containing protein [Xylogone sp. PMI_703]|nr:heterokaryon incompatibility protein-domain-containing protein [Xylogone sp. PMI_703]